MLTQYEGVVDKPMGPRFNEILLNKLLDICILYVLASGVDGLARDVAADQLDVDLVSLGHLLEIVQVRFVLLEIFGLVDGPELERHVGVEVTDGLVQEHHDGLY